MPLFFYLNKNKTVSKMKPTPKEAKVIHEHYEKVVEHLISEGYAVDKDGADNIISGMSEEWYNLIIAE
ncbi:MAG: hypothetical protein ACO3CD_06040 [Candidatus Nanopelagicaceae bacterium]|jgi:hypothetical protein